MVEVAAV